jgi:uncharacterized Fe-S center protein
MSKVYFLDAKEALIEKLEPLLEKVGVGNLKGVTALKMHMGERNNKTFVKPLYVRKIVEVVKKHGGDPFVTDTTTIYKAERYTAMDYYRTAFAHGFLPSHLGCPVIIADGLKDDGVQVNEKVEIAESIYDSDAMLVISHATGHGASSFGGAIKNIAMGCVTKKTKIYQHEVTQPVLDKDLCDKCEKCREVCEHDAISENHELILENCIGCGSCIAVCETGALKSPEDMSTNLQRRLAEVAHAVLTNLPYSKFIFVNFLIDITPFCDCAEFTPEYMSPDIGVLASKDIVAVDLATIDMIGKHLFEGDPTVQVREARRLGLGELEYEICRV